MNPYVKYTLASVLPAIGINHYHEFAQEEFLFMASQAKEQGDSIALNEALGIICEQYANRYHEAIDHEQAAAMVAVLDTIIAVDYCC